MTENKSLNNLLRWGIENSSASTSDPTSKTDRTAESSNLNPEILNAILGGPSDADLMKECIEVIKSSDSDDDKMLALENFKDLIEDLDNANNMEGLGLWEPLLGALVSDTWRIRNLVCGCIGTAVQNNEKSQQHLLHHGGIPTLVKLALEDEQLSVKSKAVFALSSAVRNCQPALDEARKVIPKEILPSGYTPESMSAGDMEAIDELMRILRDESVENRLEN